MGRLLCISDIHGHARPLQRLLAAAAVDMSRDKLVLLGDYVDRGPDSRCTVRMVRQLAARGAVALPGNHDQLFYRTWARGWPALRPLLAQFRWGGVPTLKSYALRPRQLRADAQFLGELPLWYCSRSYLFVHAGLEPGQPQSANLASVALHIREPWLLAPVTALPWTVVFGHTPTRRILDMTGHGPTSHGRDHTDADAILTLPGRIAIDTGAGQGRRLSLVDLDNGLVYWENVMTGVQGQYHMNPSPLTVRAGPCSPPSGSHDRPR